MLEPTACRFWQAALQSGLMDATGLQACWDTLPPDKRTPDAVDRRLARQAVQTGRLTLWQAQQLVAGRSTGFKIDRYVLLELIGQGGMGRVYLARDSRLNRRVAIKILSPERVNNPRAIARFHREALVGAQLQHENLVRVYDEGESHGRCYLVMEYIEGRNIGQMISEGGPISPAIAARLARQVALGLEHAQRKGLIHRDVNPYNILVTRDGVAKLTDLGLAIDLSDQDRVTRDGATVGTFDYVSPEQARHSHNVDTRSDIYSLGCSLYHMLSARVPYPTASLPEKLFGHQAAEAEPLTALVPGIPPGLAAVVVKTMRKSPQDRYATPLELALALEPFIDDPSLGSAGDDTPSIRTLTAAAALAAALTASRSTSSSTELPSRDPGLASTGFPASPSPDPTSDESPTLPAPAAAAVAPAGGSEGGVLGLNLQVDLGPELSLSESLTSARIKARTKGKGRASKKTGPKTGGEGQDPKREGKSTRRQVVTAALAAALVVATGGVLFALRGKVKGKDAQPGSTAAPRGRAKSGIGPVDLPLPQGNEVRVVAADGTAWNESDLHSAVLAAIGGKGHVLLLNAKPLVLKEANAMNVGGGQLTIRAGDGVRPRPVLNVEVKGRRPFLTTRGDAPLRLEGVTIVAHFVGSGPDPPPVIEAGASLALERCAFRVESETPPRGTVSGTRAVVLEGGALTATGCFFENFDRAIDVSCYLGVTSTVKQCMFVHNRSLGSSSADPAPAGGGGVFGGWAVRLRSMPGGSGKAGRRLLMDHCTTQGRGLLDLAGFSPLAPVTVNLPSCAVLADALVAWETVTPRAGAPATPPSRDALSWLGQGNEYDIRGKSWLLLAPGGGPLVPLPDGPTDLKAWDHAMGSERDSLPPPLRFATDPSARSEHPVPADFAVADQGTSRPVGADPAQVGPVGRAAAASR